MTPFRKCPECLHTNGEHALNCPADPYSLTHYGSGLGAMTSGIQDVKTSQRNDAMTSVRHDAHGYGLHAIGVIGGFTADSWRGGGGGGSGGPNCSGQIDGRDVLAEALKHAQANPVVHPKPDPINPSHYKAHPSGVECIQVTEHMGFNLGNAVKYIWRADLKHETPLVDLRKALWYLKREIAKLEAAA